MGPQQPDENLVVERRPDAVVARFTREVVLSGQEADAATTRLTALLAEAGRRPLLIDFSNVRSLTSLMLGKLVALNRAAAAAGARLALFSLTSDVRAILEVTRLDQLLGLYGGESEALQGTRAAGQGAGGAD
jgi:anti-sigma B factor antagonist